jgi:hypothetical protein
VRKDSEICQTVKNLFKLILPACHKGKKTVIHPVSEEIKLYMMASSIIAISCFQQITATPGTTAILQPATDNAFQGHVKTKLVIAL